MKRWGLVPSRIDRIPPIRRFARRCPHFLRSERSWAAMKCQQCDKQATFHITELTGGKPQELHLCEDHARQYLTSSSSEPTPVARDGGGAGPADGDRPDGRGVGAAGSAGVPRVRDHVLRVPQPGAAGLPPRLRLLPGPTGAADRQHSRRVGARRQAAAALRRRQRGHAPN